MFLFFGVYQCDEGVICCWFFDLFCDIFLMRGVCATYIVCGRRRILNLADGSEGILSIISSYIENPNALPFRYIYIPLTDVF